MNKDFGSQNTVEVEIEANGAELQPKTVTLQSRKCFCGLIFDKVHEYKDCTVYYHAKGCNTILTIPNKKKD
jgi:hypothetical protein